MILILSVIIIICTPIVFAIATKNLKTHPYIGANYSYVGAEGKVFEGDIEELREKLNKKNSRF